MENREIEEAKALEQHIKELRQQEEDVLNKKREAIIAAAQLDSKKGTDKASRKAGK